MRSKPRRVAALERCPESRAQSPKLKAQSSKPHNENPEGALAEALALSGLPHEAALRPLRGPSEPKFFGRGLCGSIQ